jgi:hypothetical protein
VGDAQAVLPHVLDMLGPGVDEGDVLARLHHVRARIPPDRTGADDRDSLPHGVLLAIPMPQDSAPVGPTTMLAAPRYVGSTFRSL